jgi:hypothetical protein
VELVVRCATGRDDVSDPVWLVLFRGERAPSSETVFTALAALSGVLARHAGTDVVVEDLENGVRLRVAVSAAPRVREEAEEMSQLAESPQAAEGVASCNMRFEITWPREASQDVTNTLCLVAEALGNAVGGPSFVFDPDVGAFV